MGSTMFSHIPCSCTRPMFSLALLEAHRSNSVPSSFRNFIMPSEWSKHGQKRGCVCVYACNHVCDLVKVYVWTQSGKRGGMLRVHSD